MYIYSVYTCMHNYYVTMEIRSTGCDITYNVHVHRMPVALYLHVHVQ